MRTTRLSPVLPILVLAATVAATSCASGADPAVQTHGVDFGDALVWSERAPTRDITTTVSNTAGDRLLMLHWHQRAHTIVYELPGQAAVSITSPWHHMELEGASYAAYMIYRDNRDYHDSPGCDWFPDTVCTTQCCADHDACYQSNGCTYWSHGRLLSTPGCRACNDNAYSCVGSSGFTACRRETTGPDGERRPRACESFRCGCDDHTCYDASMGAGTSYCAPACGASGTLPPGARNVEETGPNNREQWNTPVNNSGDDPDGGVDDPMTTPDDVDAGTDDPPPTTDDPDAGTDDPPPTTDDPDAGTDDPPPTTDDPDAGTDDPTVTDPPPDDPDAGDPPADPPADDPPADPPADDPPADPPADDPPADA